MKPEEGLNKQFTKFEIEKIVGEPIKDFSVGSGSKKGDNVAGNLLAIKVSTDASPDIPLHLVYKSFPDITDPEQMSYVVGFGIFRTETCMYEVVFPRVAELLEQKPKAKIKSLPVVKYISGFNNDKDDYICMEDVRMQGFIMQDKFQCLTKPEVTLVMKELARFHALTYYLIQYDGEKMFEENDRLHHLKYNPFTIENPLMVETFPKMFKGYMNATVELLEHISSFELAKHMQKFADANDYKKMYELQRFQSKRTDMEMFPCIALGDVWTNNILFSYSEMGNRETPKEAKFIDFQMSRRGNIFEDLGYFFWTSTTPDFRRENLTNMLAVYYDSFATTLEEMEFPKPIGFTKGSFIDGFNKGILASYVYMPFALSLQMGDLDYLDNAKSAGLEEDEEEEEKKMQKEEVEVPSEQGAPAFNLDAIIEKDTKLMKLRMIHSPRALARLEDLTREIVELDLLH